MFGPANVPGGSLNTKQEKLTGVKGQVVGFDENGNAVPQDAPDTGVTTFNGRAGAVTPQAGDYTAEQVGAVPAGRTVNGKPLGNDITLTAADVGAVGAGGTAAAAEKLAAARALQVNLSSSIAASFDGSADVNPGVTGTLPVRNGGTGSATATAALYKLVNDSAALDSGGLAEGDLVPIGDVSASSGKKITLANFVSFISGKIAAAGSAIADRLGTARNIRVNLSSTSAASFDGSADVNPGVTGTLPVSSGGTGATSAAAARSNLGAASASHTHYASDITSGTLPASRLPTIPISGGGTGATSASAARSNLGAASVSHTHSASDLTSGTLSASRLPTISVSKGGTGATTAAAALTALGAFPAAGGTVSGNVSITGNLRLKGSSNYGNILNFGDNDYVHLSEPTDDNLEIKAKNVNFVVSGKVTKNGTEIGGGSNFTIRSSVPSSLGSGQVAFIY